MSRLAFVTGGTGFVGSHLVEKLLARGYEVRCLVRNRLKWLDGLDVTPIHGSLHDLELVKKALDGVNVILHAGAVTRSLKTDVFYRENVLATENLLRSALSGMSSLERVVLFSSQAAVGASEVPVTESGEANPISGYGRSKRQMEEMAERYFSRLPITIVRPPSVYGPREADIYTFVKTVNRGICPIVGNGTDRLLNLVYVEDLIEGILQLTESASALGEILHLGGHRNYSWLEIRDAVTEAIGRKAFTIHIPESVVYPLGLVTEFVGRVFGSYPPLNREKATEAQRSWCFSSDRAASLLNYAPAIGLREGMRKTVLWYKDNGWL